MKILGISGRENIKYEEVRRHTGQERLEDIIRRRRLRWLGRLRRMEDKQIPKQAMGWKCRHVEREEAVQGNDGGTRLLKI